MIDRFNMISMDGIDIVESQGVEVKGLYNRLVKGIAICRYQILYNWYFAKVPIPPTTVELILDDDTVSINRLISIGNDDVIHVYSLESTTVINPLEVNNNGTYSVPSGVDGFNPVTVSVNPNIQPLQCTENGVYNKPEGVDGFDPVTVAVESEYSIVPPEYYGLATAYQSLNGGFYTTDSKTQCLYIAHIEADAKYVVFLPNEVSTRFRAASWPGKTLSDFSPYLDAPATNVQVYSGGQMITPSTELQGDGLTRRFFFDGVDGEVIIGTSNTSQLVEPILLKIKQ